MYLQTYAGHIAIYVGIKRRILPAFVLLLGNLIFTAACAAQSFAQTDALDGPIATLPAADVAAISTVRATSTDRVNFDGPSPSIEINQLGSSSSLPNAPSAVLQTLRGYAPDTTQSVRTMTAPVQWKRIPPGWAAQPLTPREKMELGVEDLYSPLALLSYTVAAGYEHLRNGQPNYGTDSPAFGERLGAAVLRDTSEAIFTDVVFAPMLQEDPRYYVQGREQKFLHRVMYAITRPLITRTDDGRETVNGAQLLGYAGAAALTNAYYPQINRNFHDTAATFGGAIGGSALTNLASEFAYQILEIAHLKKVQ